MQRHRGRVGACLDCARKRQPRSSKQVPPWARKGLAPAPHRHSGVVTQSAAPGAPADDSEREQAGEEDDKRSHAQSQDSGSVSSTPDV